MISFLKYILKFFTPKNIARIYALSKKKMRPRAQEDEQLQLYHRLLPSGFLHYGYFSDPHIPVEDITFPKLEEAQMHYAQKIVELAQDKGSPVLDVGAGMGGISNLFQQKGFTPMALTPDFAQVEFIKRQYPDRFKIVCSKFEDFPVSEHSETFGTVVNSESLQYIDLDRAIANVLTILKPGGRWIISDYFRLSRESTKSGHLWETFLEKIQSAGFSITHREDITPHILPTIGYGHFLSTRMFIPLWDFAIHKLARKRPVLHYILEEKLDRINHKISDQLAVIDPEKFAEGKRYMMLGLEKRP